MEKLNKELSNLYEKDTEEKINNLLEEMRKRRL